MKGIATAPKVAVHSMELLVRLKIIVHSLKLDLRREVSRHCPDYLSKCLRQTYLMNIVPPTEIIMLAREAGMDTL